MSVHIFGIRHHGPGSARSLCQALAHLKPDIVLVEGPPDAEAMLPLLVHPEMQPPVALLVYVPDCPQQAVYYPLAVFSPEWQAIHYGLTQQIPVWLIDLPQAHRFALDTSDSPETPETLDRSDPLRLLAQAAGYQDSEHWWEDLVEQRRDSTDLFAAILEAMTVLRAEVEQAAVHPAKGESLPIEPSEIQASPGEQSVGEPSEIQEFPEEQSVGEPSGIQPEVQASPGEPGASPQLLEAQREAYMRQRIRAAQRQGFETIAVVCGAWHAPALATMPTAKTDTALLKGLPKLKVTATWIPWTYRNLARSSGYGAGIESPGWYEHLWQQGEAAESGQDFAQASIQGSTQGTDARTSSIHWMTRVARLLRQQDLDASSASVIEAVRLAETLSALRDRSFPGLSELNEAAQTVLCFGDTLPLRVIHNQLIVGQRLGQVPAETPMVPLQQDLFRQLKRLRLKPETANTELDLDLRKPMDLARSHLLHRLVLLGLTWARYRDATRTKGMGTFRESWHFSQWQPEFALRLIEAGIWGNTLEQATTAWTCDRANRATLPDLTHLIEQTLLANLPEAIAHLITRLESEAAIASDITHLMAALPPLVNVMRYGNVRQVDTIMVAPVVEGLITRICIGLPLAAVSLDDGAAANLYQLLISVQGAIALLQHPDALAQWQQVLAQLSDQQGLHGLIAGRCCRLLFEAGFFSPEETSRRLGFALSMATDPPQAAAWIEGFLSGSGLLLLHNPALWEVLEDWVMQLSPEGFTATLPLLRRTFATFAAPERRQMAERVRQGQTRSQGNAKSNAFDWHRADAALPLITQLLGLPIP
ncbi:DUF5682 family protein [Leptolyngbya sp. PCC 6406]|uniref:DUF5682 family protein n=1 Tax=Leptolyngbya sp. PCC 6406 TaxID=1173264 RepID=UPI0002AC0BD5|nr:DUF5682 family protein [Leptolyngbya sp. PCC 6406]